ncbi:hypothetical protein JCM11641_000029 [Rhodosporidiobolus odoratus]
MPTLSLQSYATAINTAATTRSSQALAELFSLSTLPGSRDTHQSDLLHWLGRPERGDRWSDRLADTPNPTYARFFRQHNNIRQSVPWGEMASSHVGALVALHPYVDPISGQSHGRGTDFVLAYTRQHEVVTALYRYLIEAHEPSTGWALLVLYAVCRDLRRMGEEADQQLLASGQKATKLEEASRLLQKCFSCCLNDRSPDVMKSRKMGTYYLATLLFKTYFKLNSTALCRNLIRGIHASSDVPPLSRFPAAHQVTYKYYMGVFAFLREEYGEAERLMSEALAGCRRGMRRNIDLILDYLIPLLLLRGVFPSLSTSSTSTTSAIPQPLLSLYLPFAQAIQSGDIAAYDEQLERAQKRLMKRGTYLVVERAREGAVRGGIKKAWILEGKPARMSIETFRKYLVADQQVGKKRREEAEGRGDGDEKAHREKSEEERAEKEKEKAEKEKEKAEKDPEKLKQREEEEAKESERQKEREREMDEECECLLANLIAKGLMKGYMSHAHKLVVLSKEKPFPWYPPYRSRGEAYATDRAEREKEERGKVPVLPPLAPPATSTAESRILTVTVRPVLVYSAPNSGKSTLVSRLATSTGEPSTRYGHENTSHPNANGPLSNGTHGQGQGNRLDLGMGFEVLDVRDEGDEGETLARLSLFQLPSPSAPYPSLLSLALTPQTLLESLIVIVLDWERPWRFIEELEGWVGVLEERLGRRGQSGEGWREVEGRERVEAFLRAYQEPPASGASATVTSTSATTLDPDAPLPPGTLVENFGIGLVIVCTKADQINTLEREREFTEEQFDYIQQTLRVVALRCGAALFYTSTQSPTSFSKLRQYILHRLFSSPTSSATVSSSLPPPASPSSATPPAQPSSSRTPATTAASTSTFPFPHRANVIDRDGVLVPSGWDSWGKIRVLRERFECEACGEGWEADLARVRARARDEGRRARGGGEGQDEDEAKGSQEGLRKEFEMVVVDFEGVDAPSTSLPPVSSQPEQSFLTTHYTTLQEEAAKDPRLAFRQPPGGTGGGGLGPSLVGPMAGSTLELPSVVSALERAREKANNGGGGEDLGRSMRGPGMSRQNSSTSAASARSPPLPSSSTFSSTSPNTNAGLEGHDSRTTTRQSPSLSSSLLSRQPPQSQPQTAPAPSAAVAAAAGGGGGGTAAGAAGGNQVLADFFQSLLTARTAGGSATAAGGVAPGAAGASGGTGAGLGQSTRRREGEGEGR